MILHFGENRERCKVFQFLVSRHELDFELLQALNFLELNLFKFCAQGVDALSFLGELRLGADDLLIDLAFNRLTLPFVFRSELFKRACAHRVIHTRHDKRGEVDNFFERRQRHVEHRSNLGWGVAEEPDVRDWRGELDVAHAFATNKGVRDFYSTLVTNDALVPDLLIFSTVTFPVLGWAEDFFGEETTLLWFLCTVVDGFWLRDFSVGPRADHFRGSEFETDGIKVRGLDVFRLKIRHRISMV